MMTRFASCIVVLIAFGGTALADMGPPPGLKRAKTTNRIETRVDLRDHVVVLVQHPLPFGTPEERKSTAEFAKLPLDVTGHYRASAELLLVPRAIAEEFRTPREMVEAAKTHTDIQRFPLRFDEDVPAWFGTEFTIHHELVRNDASGEYQLIRSSWQPYKQCCVVLIALPVLVIFLGFRFIRWLFRGVNKPTLPPPSGESPIT